MSGCGYLEVFQRVPWISRYRESIVFSVFDLFSISKGHLFSLFCFIKNGPMYSFYISVAIAAEPFTLPAKQMMVRDPFVVFCFCLEFHKALVALELYLKLFSVGILHLKYTLDTVTAKICILNSQTHMDCYP